MKVADYIKRLAAVEESERSDLVEAINIQNYAMNMLSETDMWILRTAAENSEYLNDKLREANGMSMDTEAPVETSDMTVEEETPLEAPAEETIVNDETVDSSVEISDDSETDVELELDMSDDTTSEEPTMDVSTEDTTIGDDTTMDVSTEEPTMDVSTEETSSDDFEPEHSEEDFDLTGGSVDVEKTESQTSIAGVGILPLINEIQEKLANGKPSEAEIAAVKALKKVVADL